jgi:hypothetical protein
LGSTFANNCEGKLKIVKIGMCGKFTLWEKLYCENWYKKFERASKVNLKKRELLRALKSLQKPPQVRKIPRVSQPIDLKISKKKFPIKK